jgi:hypothetical protein
VKDREKFLERRISANMERVGWAKSELYQGMESPTNKGPI